MKKIIIAIMILLMFTVYGCSSSSVDIINRINDAKSSHDLKLVSELLDQLKTVDEGKYNQEMTFLNIYIGRTFEAYVDEGMYDGLIAYISEVNKIFPNFTDEDLRFYLDRTIKGYEDIGKYPEIKEIVNTLYDANIVVDQELYETVNAIPVLPNHNITGENIYDLFQLRLTSDDQIKVILNEEESIYRLPLDLEIGQYDLEFWSESKYGVESERTTISFEIIESADLNTAFDYLAYKNLANFYDESEKYNIKIYDVIREARVEGQVLHVTGLLNEPVIIDVYLAGLKVATAPLEARGEAVINLPYPGTDYEIVVKKDNKLYLSSMEVSTSVSEEQLRRGLFFSKDYTNIVTLWDSYLALILEDEKVIVDTIKMDGVDVSIIYNEEMMPLDEVSFKNLKYNLLTNFHRINNLFGGYPYKEYVIAFIDGNQSTPQLNLSSPNGVIYSYDYVFQSSPENYAKSIIRSWLPMLTIETQSLDVKWVWEGLTQLIATSLSDYSSSDFLVDPILLNEKSLDGNWGAEVNRASTDLSNYFNVKSQIVHRMLLDKFLEQPDVTPNDYFKAFYVNLVVNHPTFDRKNVRTLPLNLSINDFKDQFSYILNDEAYVQTIFDHYVTGNMFILDMPYELFEANKLPTYFPTWPNEENYKTELDENLIQTLQEQNTPNIKY